MLPAHGECTSSVAKFLTLKGIDSVAGVYGASTDKHIVDWNFQLLIRKGWALSAGSYITTPTPAKGSVYQLSVDMGSKGRLPEASYVSLTVATLSPDAWGLNPCVAPSPAPGASTLLVWPNPQP